MRTHLVHRSIAVAISIALAAGSTAVAAQSADAGLCATPDGNRVFKRIPTLDAAQRELARSVGGVVHEYGDFSVVEIDPAAEARALARLGGAASFTRIDTTISLRHLRFDPAIQLPQALADACAQAADAAPDAEGYFLVQLNAPAQDGWLEQIRAVGAEVLQYVPDNAFLVHGSNAQLARIVKLSPVRWTAPHTEAFKVGDELAWAIAGTVPAAGAIAPGWYGAEGPAFYDVAVFARANLDAVAAAIGAIPDAQVLKQSRLPNNFFNTVRVQLSPDAVIALLALPDVFSLEPWIAPQREDERAAHIVAGNYTGTGIGALAAPGYDPMLQFGVTGAGVTVGVVDDGVGIPGDGGFYITAANTVNGPLRGATVGAQGHGHLDASIIAGTTPFSVLDPLGYNYGRGVAPGAHIVNIPLLRSGYTGSDQDAQQDPFLTAGPNGNGARVTNNSWGAGTNGNAYDSLAASFDGFARDVTTAAGIDPLIIVFSAGNSGTSGLTRPKMAKNVIAVASSENLRGELDAAANNIDDISSFSSRGPAADGRIKPDISAPGQAISGGRSGSSALFGNIDAHHRWSSGTSHAAPQVAGAIALFVEAWADANSGAIPSPALVKAALINGAVEMGGTTTPAARPNGVEGWGRIHMGNVLTPGVSMLYRDQSTTLSAPGESVTLSLQALDPARPVRVSLAWMDPPGASDPALVNNLDLEVVAGADTYRGNVLTGGQSVTGGSADIRNNIENVFLPAGAVGAFQVTVRATALNGDGALGNADLTDQHYSLVCFNCSEQPDFVLEATPSIAPVCGADGADIGITLGTISGYTGTVTLSSIGHPAPSIPTFVPPVVVLPGTSDFNLATAGVAPGNYPFQISGTDGVLTRTDDVLLQLDDVAPLVPTPVSPANGANGVSLTPTLSWTAAAGARTYTIEIDDDPGFGSIDYSATVSGTTHQVATPLQLTTGYSWRVSADNACGNGGDSSVFSFQTAGVSCSVISYSGGSLPIPPSGTAGTTISTITSALDASIIDVNVEPMVGTHTFMGDLNFNLTSPGGTSVQIMANSCGAADNFNLGFDDDAAPGAWPCPPTTGLIYRPSNPLAAFNGENANGTWTLTINDTAGGDSGALTAWGLELCVESGTSVVVANDDTFTAVEDTVMTVPAAGVLANDAGASLTATVASLPANGSLMGDAIAADGSFSYTPDANVCGVAADSFTYTASDGVGSDTATVTIDITCVNDAPVATPQSLVTNEDTALPITLAGQDVDGDMLTFNVLTQPANGALTGTSPNLTYTPAPDYFGPDSFTFEADDGDVASAPATVSIMVNPVDDGSAIANDDTASVQQFSSANLIDVLDNDVADPDDASLSIASVGMPANGSASIDSGQISYTPTGAFCGNDSFSYTVNGGDSADVSVQVVCTVPEIFSDGFED